MIELINLYWKLHRLRVAIVITGITFGSMLLFPLFNSGPYKFLAALSHSAANIGLYLMMTPVFMIVYYIYKKQQLDRNPSYKADMPEIFNLDTFLKVYTIYATLAFVVGQLLDKIMLME